jgi:PAS domain S-box-containing protein
MHPAAPPSVNHEYMTQKLHILVVEDNFGDFILIEQMLLEIRDFQKDILHVTTLAEATKRMEEQHCDVVLLDLSLPDSYGIDSFHRLSKLFPQTPVIIMSGLNDTRFANEAVKQGAQEYLVKGEFEERLLAKSISYSIERKASMELLRESQETYRLLFENNPIPMYIRAKDSLQIVGVNQSAIEHFGYSEAEFLTKAVTDLHPADERDSILEIIGKWDGGDSAPATYRHICKDGSIVFVECRVREMFFKGNPCILVLADDITDKLRVQEEVTIQANILKNVRDTIFVANRRGEITYWNEGAEQTFGYLEEEMSGKNYDLLYPEIDKHLVRQEIQEIIAGKRSQWESKLITRAGKIIWSDNKASLLHDEKGKVSGYIRVCKDITMSKRFGETQKETVAMLNSIFNTVDQGILLLDPLGRIKAFNLTANKQCIQLLGAELTENNTFTDFLLADMQQNWLNQFNRAKLGEQVHDEMVFRFRPGSEFWFGMSFSPVSDDTMHVIGVCVSMIDITERKRNDERFRSQFIEIENNNRELDKLVKVLSHDLRAPLNSVSGLISLARDEKNPLEFGNYLNMMEKSLRKLEAFTNDMISSLKNRGSVVLSELKPHDLVDEIIDELRFAADAGGIRFENAIPEDCLVLSDPSRLRIIFSNLISNAIRYHDAKKVDKQIIVRCDRTALTISFSIEDNGLGIADEHQSNIFETYYTIGNAVGSSGLGLSNVRDAVEKLRGKIELKSKLGEGSAFTIVLPLN